MKKFVFSLAAVYEYKQTVEKLQKADLSNAQAVLRALQEEEQRLELAYDNNKKTLEEALAAGTGVADALMRHDAYFRYLRDAREMLAAKIIKAEEHKEQCQALLITTMRELKTYENLRAEQYADYLKEVQAEEEKNMGDLVSFNIISGNN